MNFLTMQPAFVLDVPLEPNVLTARIRKAIHAPELNRCVASAGACVDFKVGRDERRFWSPHLNVEVNEADNGAQLYCRYSPRPEVWTMFMAIYLVAGCLILGSAILGYVQWILDGTPWALFLIPVFLTLIASLHIASLVGQRLSSDQMENLRHCLDRTLEIAMKDQV